MFKGTFIFSLLLVVGVFIGSVALMPQTVVGQADEPSVEELYERAREYAFQKGNYKKARKLSYRALDRSPNYHGIRIFVARLYAWEENYRKARQELEYVLERDPENQQGLSVLIDVERWDKNYEKALKLNRKALEAYPAKEEFMLMEGSILEAMERLEEAETAYREVIRKHSGSRKARERLKELRLKRMKYEATLSYRYDSFSTIFEPWSFWEFQLSRQTSYGSLIGRLQRANRFSTRGLQFNLDAYPSITEGMYAYLSAGYSTSAIYPHYRFGLSLYKSLPSAFELEGGIRYLDFQTSQTTIYTMSLTKYKGSYMLTARSYFIPSAQGHSGSVSVLAQRYFGNASTYAGIRAGYGGAASDIQFREDLRRLGSWSVELTGQYPLTERLNLGASIGFDSEELPNSQRDRVSVKGSVSYRF